MGKAINALREEAYGKLNDAGKIKPLHDFKGQMERVLNMILQKETSIAEKTKMALMEEATAEVTKKFSSSKALKKAALTAAIAQIKGDTATKRADPVSKEFVEFFKAKSAAIAKAADGSEEKMHREAIVAKINAVAKNEGFFFELGADGVPKVTQAA